MEAISEIIPKQVVGSQTGATSKLKLNSRRDVLQHFQATCKRLLDIIAGKSYVEIPERIHAYG